MKTLVLCVDRDDDIGVKTGIRGPIVGREGNLAAATKLGLADPEDSDVNALLSAASGLALILAGLYLIVISLPFSSLRDFFDKAGQQYERVRDSVATGDLSIFFNVSTLILILVGVFFGIDFAGRSGENSYVVQFLRFVFGSIWFFVIGALCFEGGKVVTAYLRHRRAPRHALAVAVSFVALGLLVLGMTQILQTIFGNYNPSASLPLIYLSIGLALFLVAVTGLSYRSREERPEPVDET